MIKSVQAELTVHMQVWAPFLQSQIDSDYRCYDAPFHLSWSTFSSRKDWFAHWGQ